MIEEYRDDYIRFLSSCMHKLLIDKFDESWEVVTFA